MMLLNDNMIWLAETDERFEGNPLVAEESQIRGAGQ